MEEQEPRLSEIIEEIRNEMCATRSKLLNAYHKHGWKDRLDNCEGLLTCGISYLYNSKKEIREFEIKGDDIVLGGHMKFYSRGLGMDVCPSCWICGGVERHEGSNHYLNNISAIVSSKEDGDKINDWFGGRGWLDIRDYESDYIQLKIGVCDKHLPNLKMIDKITRRYGVIRECDVVKAFETKEEIES